MVNLHIRVINDEEAAANLVYSICDHLAGLKAFRDNTILVPDADKDMILISLGEGNDVLDIYADHVSDVSYTNTPDFYLCEENASGIKVNSKQELLDRISKRIDEILINNEAIDDSIEVLIIK